ncbi:GDSL-like lipase/acylhydrolase family protein [Stackebrandtia albiflava]|uniref:GDSL-like lipase/acylhydrolase family protein n=1 Tax=Stackebrandtia albiflava TaxID=406432 RepID=A0A562UY41_9ACTN|nr:SGNH/GDSL hydrolase family protein [Stackebrandtia albiflava]TWJ10560.1 GDSL-like lipase/acylhydrolase family protein [Stackebrandtia albiflava]
MRTARLSLTLVAALAVTFVFPSVASANESIEYVAMGDSFASGSGAGNYAEISTDSWKGGDCLQSQNAYSPLLADQLGATLDFQSCSGAKVADIHSDQLPALSAGTDLVTLSVGGNDVGFSSVIITCTTSSTAGCTDKVEAAEADAQQRLPGLLSDLYAEIGSRAPNAQVLILGYPKLFSGRSCFGNTGINLDEQARINEANYVLNGVISTAAQNAGFTYVDPIPAFEGHGVCTSGAYVNGLRFNIPESYHPNRNGHGIGYMEALNAHL